MAGEYRRERVSPNRLGGYLRERRADPAWRGCSGTIPLMEAVSGYLDELDPAAAASVAVNCVVAYPSGLIGYNSYVDGGAAALRDVPIEGS